MHGKSLAYWRLPEEEETFLRLVASVEETVVFPILRAGKRKELSSVPISDYIASWKSGTVLFARPGVKVEVQDLGHRRYTILARTSEVISHRAGRVIEEALLKANLLSFHTMFLDSEMEWVRNPKEFLTWADRLRRTIWAHTIDWNRPALYEKGEGRSETI